MLLAIGPRLVIEAGHRYFDDNDDEWIGLDENRIGYAALTNLDIGWIGKLVAIWTALNWSIDSGFV